MSTMQKIMVICGVATLLAGCGNIYLLDDDWFHDSRNEQRVMTRDGYIVNQKQQSHQHSYVHHRHGQVVHAEGGRIVNRRD